MKSVIQPVRTAIRRPVRKFAQLLNLVSNGRITPNSITLFGLAMHVPIALFIATGHVVWGGVFLIIFGLFDTLDGELARLLNKVTNNGGFLDASTDRFKEVLLYSAAAYLFSRSEHPEYAVLAVIACGASICVSYVKAKGEAIVASTSLRLPYTELNRMFSGGLFPFEIRMAVLVVGLFSGQLVWAVAVVALFSTITAVQRLIVISQKIT